MKKVLYFSLTLLTLSCSPGKEEKTDDTVAIETENVSTEDMLIGEWRNLSMKVDMKSPDTLIDIPEDKWEDVLQIKPIRTTFKEDGTFISEYRSLEDSVFMTSTGGWQLKEDTLVMVEHGTANSYYFEIEDGKAYFKGYIDWDEDGKNDDLYTGEQEKL